MGKKKVEELKWFVTRAKKAGYHVGRNRNGGGWIDVAKKCGGDVSTKSQAREYLARLFGNPDGSSYLSHEHPRGGARQLTPIVVIKADVQSKDFLTSWEWTELRYRVLKHYGRKCMCCGSSPNDGAVIHVDHIQPRSTHPELALEFSNLQVLCSLCNRGKSNTDQTDWR